MPSVVTVGVTIVPFSVTCRSESTGTSETGTVTFAYAVMPVCPVAVKSIVVAVATTLDTVASLLIEQLEVPQVAGVVLLTVKGSHALVAMLLLASPL